MTISLVPRTLDVDVYLVLDQLRTQGRLRREIDEEKSVAKQDDNKGSGGNDGREGSHDRPAQNFPEARPLGGKLYCFLFQNPYMSAAEILL